MHAHVLKCVSQIFSSALKKYRYEHDATLSEKLETARQACELPGGDMEEIPLASDGHGWTLVNSKLEPLWYNGEVLPIQLADISEGSADTVVDDNGDSEDDISLPDDTDYLDTYGDSDNDD